MKDNQYERFPIVDINGRFLGTISRGHAHNGCKTLHPVVHLHVMNSQGEIYLQKRPEWKDVQPGKWDTACGGHVDLGERVEKALQREVEEELGITNFVPRFVVRYPYESQTEYELVHVYLCLYDGQVSPSKSEVEDGRFWTIADIHAAIGKNVLTPNFESEFKAHLLPFLRKIDINNVKNIL